MSIRTSVVAAAMLMATSVSAAGQCSGAEYHQFDFFIGDWDAYDAAAPTKVTARDQVTPMVGGCAVREVYEQNDGMVGESFSVYDRGRHLWHQSWVTNRGQVLLLDGRFENGRLTLTATDYQSAGGPSLLRGIWYTQGDGVRETAERSTDGGKTWKPEFDILFRPHGKS
jgi:hypothetical protein